MSNSSKSYHKIIIINWKWKRKLLPTFPHLLRTESAQKDVSRFKTEFEEKFVIDPVKQSKEHPNKNGIVRLKADLSRRSTEEGILELKEQLRNFIVHFTLARSEQILFFSHRNYLGNDLIQQYEHDWVYQNFLNQESVVYHLLDYNTGDYGIDVVEEIEDKKHIDAAKFSLVWEYAWTRWHEKLVHFYNHLSNYTLRVGKESEESIKIRISNMAANFDSSGYEEFSEFQGNAYVHKLEKSLKISVTHNKRSSEERNVEIIDDPDMETIEESDVHIIGDLDIMDLPATYNYASFIAQKDERKVENIRKVIFTIARGDFTHDNLLLAKNLIKEVV